MEILDATTIRSHLDDLEGWSYDGDRLTRTLTFATFPDAIAFIVRVADLAEAANHHPDLHNSYTRVEVALTTHSAGGVTSKDVDLARQIDEVVPPPAAD